LLRLLRNDDEEEITRGLLTIVSLSWNDGQGLKGASSVEQSECIESLLFHEKMCIWDAAAWAWGVTRSSLNYPKPSSKVLNHLLSLWLNGTDRWGTAPYAIRNGTLNLTRGDWQPLVTEEQKVFLKNISDEKQSDDFENLDYTSASLVVAFHAQNFWSEAELGERLLKFGKRYGSLKPIPELAESMLARLHGVDLKKLRRKIGRLHDDVDRDQKY
jgi:hypothetical protein